MQVGGSVCVVTGASRGIGRVTAELLHARGASVGLIARSADELAEVATAMGERVAVASADVTDRSQVDAAMDALADRLGPIDVLVNNAGLGQYSSVLETEVDVYEHVMAVNYLGTVYATKAVLGGMCDRRRGHVVNVASVAGVVGAPFESAYAGAKFAVVGFTESLAAEMGSFGVGVSVVNPGPVRTSFEDARGVPFQREKPTPLEPEVVAEAIVRAITDDVYEQVLPRWLRVGPITRAVVPGLFRKGLVRDSMAESRALRDRWGSRPG